jgi:agmatine deiminase
MSKLILVFLILVNFFSYAQQNRLPHHMTEAEKNSFVGFNQVFPMYGTITPPSGSLRTMAEWEEIEAITITWASDEDMLSEILDAAQLECKVFVFCSDSNIVKSDLSYYGVTPNQNVKYIYAPFDALWIRDYGANNVYKNDVDSLILVDWVYNRPSRVNDDTISRVLSRYTGLELYETSTTPSRLVNTGGNFVPDGFGTAFSSHLVLDENPSLTTTQVDNIANSFMGINNYIHMTDLPHDGIHHVDMHMKLLDEETILFGEFPSGVSDGPQMEANILYVLNNYNSVFGTPYEIVRIPMPPSSGGNYAPNAYYRTYTNSVFANKSFLISTYYTEYDTTALRILKEHLPGYKLVSINAQGIISASGAVHCITNCVGVRSPLLISHQELDNTTSPTAYQVNARIQHKSGIQSATLYYRTDTLLPYSTTTMSLSSAINNTWTGHLPGQLTSCTMYYYIEAQANSGKQQSRPITAPAGYWKFKITLTVSQNELSAFADIQMGNVFPNPASQICCVPITSNLKTDNVEINMYDNQMRYVKNIHNGNIPQGESFYFFDANNYAKGLYYIRLLTTSKVQIQKVFIN